MARPKKPPKRPNDGTRAVLYLRVSKEDGATKHGLDVQQDTCEAYAAMKGYQVVRVTKDDGVSGATPWDARDGLREAFALCVAGSADVIVAYHQDRFARKMGVFEDIRDYALKHDVRLETADNRNLTDENDFITGDVLSLVAAIERRRISLRFYAARRHRGKQDGRGSGKLPWGYRVNDDGTLSVDEDAAQAIRLLLGMRKHGKTYQQTADKLNAEGFTTPKGGRWTVGHVQGIERNAALYRTGVRKWDGVTASEPWPIIVQDRKGKGSGNETNS